jgi:hypothetical protein
MKLKNLTLIGGVVICIAIYIGVFIQKDTGPALSVNIDLAQPLSIVWPCEIAVIGDNGEKGIRIGPKVGRGWRGEAGGEVRYRFYIPEDGRYYLWAYCLWFDECANAIFIKIDDMEKDILGNDPIYKKWHWTRGIDVELKKGTHTITLSNHSDHISLQKILFSNALLKTPDDCNLVFSDIFYDGFDGCDRGNFVSWTIVNGSWTVQNPDQQACFVENSLIGTCEDTALIMHQNNDWSNYVVNLVVKSLPGQDANGAIGVCVGLHDPNRYHYLKILPHSTLGKAKMEFCTKDGEITSTIGNFEVPWKDNVWHHVQIGLNNGHIAIKINDASPVQIPLTSEVKGGIGLMLNGKITAHFDDIHVRAINEK